MITVLMGTGISALSSLMDPVSQALAIMYRLAVKVGPAISKAVSPAVTSCKMAFAPMLKRLYPARILGLFGMGAGQEQQQVARMLRRQTQNEVQGELEVLSSYYAYALYRL